jgi:hypothetical protein
VAGVERTYRAGGVTRRDAHDVGATTSIPNALDGFEKWTRERCRNRVESDAG